MDLEQAIDELYAASLEDFVAERKRLTGALRDEGLREDAASLAAMRKPSTAAWVLNQLARTRRRDVDLLLDAGNRLREAQHDLLGGAERAVFERARKTERETLSRLITAAGELLGSRGKPSATIVGQVAESLRAAAVSADGRELLARGRFTEPLSGAAFGFDPVGQIAGSGKTDSRARLARTAERGQRREAAEALRRAKDKLRAAERAAREARREATRLDLEAEQARRAAEAAEARAAAAADEVAEAERRLAP
jgi:hypothetical protein